MVDENTFFREATLRLCSSLETEKALQRCFEYVRRHVPVDLMVLSYISYDVGGLQFVAEADEHGGRTTGKTVYLPEEVIARATGDTLPEVFIEENVNEHFILKHPGRHLEFEDPSMIAVRLILDGQFIGGLGAVSGRKGVFTREHLRLMKTLKEPAAIALSNCLRFQKVSQLKDLLADDKQYLMNEIGRMIGQDIVGKELGLKETMRMIRQVAPKTSPVILLGETGTGKEVVARAIHNMSQRRQGPFIKVNCGAIPETLLDSELFGHEKGAFTGALQQRRGRFERAEGGTIFLDEIGELPLEAQIRLLRVLQEKEIERVGGTTTLKVDIRVIAATHRDLPRMVRDGTFREDLFYRLHVFPVHIPPLRRRTVDIPALTQHFILKKTQEMGLKAIPPLAPGAMDKLCAYGWPGNVRELENVVERALILGEGRPLAFRDLPGTGNEAQASPRPPDTDGSPLTLDEAVGRHIRLALEHSDGRVEGKGGAAELLGVNASTLRHKMRRLNIPFGRKAGKRRQTDE